MLNRTTAKQYWCGWSERSLMSYIWSHIRKWTGNPQLQRLWMGVAVMPSSRVWAHLEATDECKWITGLLSLSRSLFSAQISSFLYLGSSPTTDQHDKFPHFERLLSQPLLRTARVSFLKYWIFPVLENLKIDFPLSYRWKRPHGALLVVPVSKPSQGLGAYELMRTQICSIGKPLVP